ncbi:uncharacterized protein LOC129585322 [Paramacrobiotus metropolitanus]|uniref:uncharacterized protein LOC129585322 n=1 Tax=Paramacrobiotus metropolitanus TaxID=2943436 RepID=UPI0024465299|nr:uncharacterized protein LOC129585322 [Paramacrobiotus metropolitanus]
MRCVLILAFVAVVAVKAADKGDACQSTNMCDDPGLACSGARCHCLMDFGAEQAQVWACNQASDCKGIANLALRHVEETVRQRARAPVCVPSGQCPAVPGFSGYCDVTMDA